VSLAALIPFTIHSFTSLEGAQDVGTAFCPQVCFAPKVSCVPPKTDQSPAKSLVLLTTWDDDAALA
jgi:hypothetical protein